MNDSAPSTGRIERVSLHVLRAPIAEPVRTSFGVMVDRPCVLVAIGDAEGTWGWGEIWCNYPVCGAEHRARLAAEAVAPPLVGQSFADPSAAQRFLARTLRVLALQTREFGALDQIRAGFDIALWDLMARRQDRPLANLLADGPVPPRVPVYASGINPRGAVDTVRRARASGFDAFKVKIGFDPVADRRTIAALVAERAGHERLMADANQAWSIDQARSMVTDLHDSGLEWLEEPMPADTPTSQWQTLAAASTIPLAGGENLASTAAFDTAIDAGWLAVVQPDLAKWGGFTGCLPIARRVLRAGRRYCPHYLGGGIGLIASAQALAAVGGDGRLEVDCNPNPLREELLTPAPAIADGALTLPPGPGLGVRPDASMIRHWETLCLSV